MLKVFGVADAWAFQQLKRCQDAEAGSFAVLCADHHPGYSMPIGGVIAYKNHISPTAVGVDIGCGNMAVRTDALAREVNIPAIMDDIWKTISFGMGRKNNEPVNEPLIDVIAEDNIFADLKLQRLTKIAADQLGTVGGGNHYVDLFEDVVDGHLWIGVHFGSRGFGFKITKWVIEQATGNAKDHMDAPPVLLPLDSELGQVYFDLMTYAGRYASTGRSWVVHRILKMIGANITKGVHNHHNFAWREWHHDQLMLVHRKGSTPSFPGQQSFVGATMSEPAVIIEGLQTVDNEEALYSTVHGAGRVMSRRQAAGKFKGWGPKRQKIADGVVNFAEVKETIKSKNIELRGGAADEAPECYKRLDAVLDLHQGTVHILHRLRPVGVAMASEDEFDPFKD